MMSDQEKVYYDAKVPLKAFWASHGILYLLFFGWNIGLLEAWIEEKRTRVKITSQRVVIVRGIFSHSEEDIPLCRISDCAFHQTVVGRILGTGIIEMISGSETPPRVAIPFINPREYKEIIRTNIMRARQENQTGRHGEKNCETGGEEIHTNAKCFQGQAKSKKMKDESRGNKEYRRTCKACGKVWHSLVSREKQIKRDEAANGCNVAAQCCNPSAQLQAKRNMEAVQSEMARLHQCPECGSANYDEEIV